MTPHRARAVVVESEASWWRRHCRGRATALAIWHGGRCEASVYEAPGALRMPERVSCTTTGEAMERAEGLLKMAYPHDCRAEDCAPWVSFEPR